MYKQLALVNGQVLGPTYTPAQWVGVINQEMLVYYCIDTTNRCGNFDTIDVRYALEQMDSMCQRYEASWYKWPGSFRIIGKCRSGDNICNEICNYFGFLSIHRLKCSENEANKGSRRFNIIYFSF
ncbi:hypothetical protein OIDMADRAFT_17876 [Oidiodendron maius Zn]|uniref:Uncharacterized protein n=1 Tax=Oidiodendron maius (strain Zn) TaxID=913774 RepID=A0A0C3HQI5_OIDMZ|nr:hypothetical protein OIDMADRAFT_17876 [Oidiodendron maius Zn]